MHPNERKQIIEDILYKSLISKQIKILNSNNKNQIGKEGKIILETQNFFHIEEKGSISKILKKNIEFELIHKGKALKVNGRLLIATLTQRIKKIR